MQVIAEVSPVGEAVIVPGGRAKLCVVGLEVVEVEAHGVAAEGVVQVCVCPQQRANVVLSHVHPKEVVCAAVGGVARPG